MNKDLAFISVFFVTIIWGILLVIEGIKLEKLPDAKWDNFEKMGGFFFWIILFFLGLLALCILSGGKSL